MCGYVAPLLRHSLVGRRNRHSDSSRTARAQGRADHTNLHACPQAKSIRGEKSGRSLLVVGTSTPLQRKVTRRSCRPRETKTRCRLKTSYAARESPGSPIPTAHDMDRIVKEQYRTHRLVRGNSPGTQLVDGERWRCDDGSRVHLHRR